MKKNRVKSRNRYGEEKEKMIEEASEKKGC